MCIRDSGEAECPAGYARYIVSTDICCPVARCCEISTTTTTPYITHTGTHTTKPIITEHILPTTTPTKTTTIITTEDCVCVDHAGEARYYGEVWTTGPCESCCCTAPGVVECSKIECTAPTTCAKDEYISGEYDVNECCKSVCCTKVECQETCKDIDCPKVAQPTCEYYEDCKSRAIDADCCCYEYYCECNKNCLL